MGAKVHDRWRRGPRIEVVEIGVEVRKVREPFVQGDLDAGTAPPPVMDFRSRLRASGGILISSPEYAHGVPGALKNAIDWVVSSGEIYEKPVALLNASRGATHAHASLIETLKTADANVVREASVRIGLPTNRIDEAGIVSAPKLSDALISAVARFAHAIRTRRVGAD